MRALRFMDPSDHRGAAAFGRSQAEVHEDDSPEWGQVARAAVAEALQRRLVAASSCYQI